MACDNICKIKTVWTWTNSCTGWINIHIWLDVTHSMDMETYWGKKEKVQEQIDKYNILLDRIEWTLKKEIPKIKLTTNQWVNWTLNNNTP